MSTGNIQDYKKAVKDRYAQLKDTGEIDPLLLAPTTGNLKKLCLLVLDGDINSEDMLAYKRFFSLKDGVDAYKQVESFDSQKLKAVGNFLSGTSGKTSVERLNLLAVLMDLENRPFQKFRLREKSKTQQVKISEQEITAESTALTEYQPTEETITTTFNEPSAHYGREEIENKSEGEELETTDQETVAEDNFVAENVGVQEEPILESDTNETINDTVEESITEFSDSEPVNTDQNNSEDLSAPEMEPQSDSRDYETVIIPQQLLVTQNKNWKRNRIVFILLTVVLLLFGTYMALTTLFTDSGCMMWKDDHYETVPCDMQVNVYAGQKIIPADKMLLKYQKRIEVSDTTTFFNLDKEARVFYAKMPDKKCEFFNQPGNHPETGKKLRPITDHIINRYVRVNN